jgi:polysaccharide biosynthesis protein PslH
LGECRKQIHPNLYGVEESLLMNPSKHIALISNASPWPAVTGASVRQFHLLDELLRAGYEVHLFSFCEPNEIAIAHEHLGKICNEVVLVAKVPIWKQSLPLVAALLKNAPLSEAFYSSTKLKRKVAKFFKRFPQATAIVHSSNVAYLVPPEHRYACTLDMADVDSSKFLSYAQNAKSLKRIVFQREAKTLSRLENRLIEQYKATFLVAKRELAELNFVDSLTVAKKVKVIPNGVDTAKFSPSVLGTDALNVPQNERQFFTAHPRILFTGVMDYLPNAEAVVWFVNNIWPTLIEKFPQLRFTIMGARPIESVKKLGEIPGIEVTGFVDSAVPYFRAASVVVVPLLISRGIQNKALEAMSCQCAVVAFESVVEGIRQTTDTDGAIVSVRDGDEFTNEVLALLTNPEATMRLGIAAREFVTNQHHWPTLMKQLIATHCEEVPTFS